MLSRPGGFDVSAAPEPKIPRWSAARRASPLRRKAPRKRLRAYVTGPPKGAAAPERLSALRPSFCDGGKYQTSGDFASRAG